MENAKAAFSTVFSFVTHPDAAQMLLGVVLITMIFLVVAHINRLIISKALGNDSDAKKDDD